MLRRDISTIVEHINADLAEFVESSSWEDFRRVDNQLKEHYGEFQKKFFKLCMYMNEQKTATLVSVVNSQFVEIDGVLGVLGNGWTNWRLFKSIVNTASSLLFRFKKSQYKKLIDDVAQLKQRIDLRVRKQESAPARGYILKFLEKHEKTT